MKKIVFIWILACFLLSCERVVKQTPPQPVAKVAENVPPTADSEKIIAEIGEKKIKASELENEIKYDAYEIEEQLYNMKKQSLDNMVEKIILEDEAKKQGIDVQALIKKEIDDKIQKITDAEAKDFFEKNKERIQQGFEESKDRIIKYLSSDSSRKRRNEYLQELKNKMSVKVYLEAPVAPQYNVPIKDSDPKKGKADSKVIIVEYTDFQCPFCKRAHETLQKILAEFGDKILFVYKDYPLDFHPQGKKAAEAALCARDEGKFWEYHDKIFSDAKKMDEEDFMNIAKSLNLNFDKFKECYSKGKYTSEVEEDINEGQKIGVRGTPAFFVNGKKLSGAQPYSAFKELIEKELKN